ncbi:unnamed protein product [Schistocephalus solidus]|uniref:SH3 domain-containing protein n=1 Tax=Schistocephalus solidus TaxID=70667 RepID=A0A183T5F5_SCHSO|nr:unnamed protein product [Schistocephalus solidus]
MSNEADKERESDMDRSDKSIQLWNDVAASGRERKARLEAMSASYSISAGLAQELNWVSEKLQFLEKTRQQARDTRTARDLQLAQRLCKNHLTLSNEVDGHTYLWEDIKRAADQLLFSRPVGPSRHDQQADSRGTIKRQLDATTAAWAQLRSEMAKRKSDLDECLESAQFYADADEATRWIREKVTLIKTTGILTKPLDSRNDLDRALKCCGVNSSATMLNSELLKRHSEEVDANGASSDSSIESAPGKKESGHTEGSAVVIKDYRSKDPAGRDISVSKGDVSDLIPTVAVIECTNNEWWHVCKTTNGIGREGFVPASRLRLTQAPVLRRDSSKKDALLAVKRGVSRGLSIRRSPSARNINELHFDRENIQLCEKSVMDAYNQLEDLANERGDCLQDTLAWHEFDHKCNILKQWIKEKRTLDEITATYPLLTEVEELADILTGKIPCKKRKIYKRNDGPLFYKNLSAKILKDVQDNIVILLLLLLVALQLLAELENEPQDQAGRGIQMELPTLEERVRELQVLADR